MRLVVETAVMACEHGGQIPQEASQDLVRVDGVPALVAHDPLGREVIACPIPPPAKACFFTVTDETGYSELLFIDGRAACLETISGFTEGAPPGTIRYSLPELPGLGRVPGQDLVGSDT